MERRSLLGTLGGIVGTAAFGGAGLIFATEDASATASTDYGDVTITSDDGSVQYVAIYGDSVVEWDGFDTTATQAKILVEGRVGDSGAWTELHDTGPFSLDNDDWGGADEELSGSGTSGYIKSGIGLDSNGNHDPTTDWHVVGNDPDGYGLPQNSIDPAQLEVGGDGSSQYFQLQIRSTYVWYDNGGNEIFRKSFTSTVGVTVNNEEASASGKTGDGDDGAVGA